MPFDMALGGMRVEVSTSHTEAAEPDLSCLDRHYDPAGPHPCIVTLVHGTWARGVLWASDHDYSGLKPYRPERRPSTLRGELVEAIKSYWRGVRWFDWPSEFRAKLGGHLANAGFDSTIRAFRWSGSNSIYARQAAAKKLAAILRSDLNRFPDVPSVIVAHSHGGNVALLALSELGSDAARVRVVTLATPFLRVLPTRFYPFEFFLQLVVAMVLLTLSFLGLGLWQAENHVDSYVIVFASIVILSGCHYAAKLILIFGINTSEMIRIGRFLPRPAWQERPERIAEAVNADFSPHRAPHLFVMRGVDDEAALTLAAGAIGARLTKLLAGGVAMLLFLPSSAVSVMGLLLLYGRVSRAPSGDPFVMTITHLTCLLTPGTLSLLLAPGAFKSVFGREFLFGTGRCQISADLAPDMPGAEIVTLSPEETKWGLGHALYDHRECARTIVKWLADNLRKSSPH